MKSESDIYYPETVNDWREWLLQNGNIKESVWLVFYKKESDFPNISWTDAVDEALCFGWKVHFKGEPTRKQGLLYFATDGKGEKKSHPFKASLFGRGLGMEGLELHFLKSKEVLKNHQSKEMARSAISNALKQSHSELDFKKKLKDMGINVVVRRNETGRIYGITFIDHHSKTVWNGSRLGKDLSANVFNECWKSKGLDKHPFLDVFTENNNKKKEENLPKDKSHELFDFLNKESSDLIGGLGGIIPEAQGVDNEEEDFANRMKK